MQIVGIILILVSGVGAAWVLLQGQKRELESAEAVLELLLYVKTAVDTYSMTASEMLRSCNSDIVRKMGYSGEEPPSSFLQLLEASEISDGTVRDIFSDFARSFGKNYRRRQSEDCSLAIERLRVRVSELEKALPVRRRMIVSICISVSLILVILLL